MTSFQTLLLSIASTANEILETVDVTLATPVPNSARRDQGLLPPISHFAAQLRHHLSTISLDDSLRQSAVDLFTQRADHLRCEMLDVMARALGQMAMVGGAARSQEVRCAFEAQFARCMTESIQLVLQPLKTALAAYEADVDSAASAESSSESEDGGEGGARGHRAEAVAILERAYAYAQNITQAEKRKLAELTGLEPRQVVIW